eukprot:g4637.t1
MSEASHVDGLSTPAGDIRLRAEHLAGTDASSGFMQQLRVWQVLNTESVINSAVRNTVDSLISDNRTERLEPMVSRPFRMGDSVACIAVKTEWKTPEKRKISVISHDLTEEQRLERRREINRNSQRRIRKRRAREVDELRSQCSQFRQENQKLLRQIEFINVEKVDLLRQIQEITEKWQQSIKDNALLNREILLLRSEQQPKKNTNPSQNTNSLNS